MIEAYIPNKGKDRKELDKKGSVHTHECRNGVCELWMLGVFSQHLRLKLIPLTATQIPVFTYDSASAAASAAGASTRSSPHSQCGMGKLHNILPPHLKGQFATTVTVL